MVTIHYLLESAFCLACLYALYWFFLRRETFFQWNRAYLLLAPVLAFILPALHIPIAQPNPAEPVPAPQPDWTPTPEFDLPVWVENVQTAQRTVGQALEHSLGWCTLGEVLWWLYLGVTAVLLIHLAVRIFRLLHFLRRCNINRHGNLTLATGPESTPLASFFGIVFWHPGTADAQEQRYLIEHELVHVQQWHSLDLILMELLIAFQWFNPLLYIYRRSLRSVHEYIADAVVVNRLGRRHAYAQLLVRRQHQPGRQPSDFVNTFHSFIKNRLEMLAKIPSRPYRRVKYLLALPLFAALMLLFSFRLIEHLPAAKPLHEALQTAENYAENLSEVVIQAPGNWSPEPTPYNFYWGSLSGKFMYDAFSKSYSLELESSPEEVREALKREPRLWNGKSLEQHLVFSCDGLPVRTDYNNEAVYAGVRSALEERIARLSSVDVLELRDLRLPNGETATVRITLGIEPPNWLPRQRSEVQWQTDAGREHSAFLNLQWGEKHHADQQFFTETEFWEFLENTPTINFNAGSESVKTQEQQTPQKFSCRITNPGGQILRQLNDLESAWTLEQLRKELQNLRTELKPGAIVWITGWTPSQAATADDAGSNWRSGSAVFQLVGPYDPRRFLRRTDRKTYFLEWGNLSLSFASSYARTYRDNNGTFIHADNPKQQRVATLTKTEIIRMLQLPARLYREKELLPDFNFTLDFKGYGVLVKNADVPADLIQKLERELQAGDVLKITGIQARAGGPMQLVLPTHALGRLRMVAARHGVGNFDVETLESGELSRITFSAAAAKILRKEIKDEPGFYLQYGDIDLLNSTVELEVRADDPKPTLRQPASLKTENSVTLKVRPNPAHAHAIVDIQLPEAGTGLLTVVDAGGVVRFSLKTAFQAGHTPFRLPAEALPAAGIYSIRLEMPYGSAAAKLLVE
ncbi:MAG: M56 family metallopeptidase [Saprospiraceae bacterium]